MIKINDITIAYSKSKLIDELKKYNVSYKRNINLISFDMIVDNENITVGCFCKGNFIYQVTVTGKSNPLDLSIYGELKTIDDIIECQTEDLSIEYKNNKNSFVIYFRFKKLDIKNNNKIIYIALIAFWLLVTMIGYLVMLSQTSFDTLTLVFFVVGGLCFGILSCGGYYFYDNMKHTNSYDKLSDDALPGYLASYRGLSTYGNPNNLIKVKPMIIYVYDSFFIINVLYKGKNIRLTFKLEDTNVKYDKSFTLYNKDREIAFFIDDDEDRLGFVEHLKHFNLI